MACDESRIWMGTHAACSLQVLYSARLNAIFFFAAYRWKQTGHQEGAEEIDHPQTHARTLARTYGFLAALRGEERSMIRCYTKSAEKNRLVRRSTIEMCPPQTRLSKPVGPFSRAATHKHRSVTRAEISATHLAIVNSSPAHSAAWLSMGAMSPWG
jgi:hypothetical protein